MGPLPPVRETPIVPLAVVEVGDRRDEVVACRQILQRIVR
jgi:hypothetical protein